MEEQKRWESQGGQGMQLGSMVKLAELVVRMRKWVDVQRLAAKLRGVGECDCCV